MSGEQSCSCGPAPVYLFPCSGAADVAELGHQAARRMTRSGVGKMYCLAGIGGRVEEIVTNTRSGGIRLAIDGCDKDCATRCLQEGGVGDVISVRVTDLGFEKGATRVSPDNIDAVSSAATTVIHNAMK